MKFSLNKSLEEIERDNWAPPSLDSTGLVKKIHLLRKKPLKDFTIEDLRIIIGQNFSLEYVMPYAIEKLKENILAEGDLYEGDLLNNVLNANTEFWKNNQPLWSSVNNLFESQRHLFDEEKDLQLLKSFKKFQSIHNAD